MGIIGFSFASVGRASTRKGRWFIQREAVQFRLQHRFVSHINDGMESG